MIENILTAAALIFSICALIFGVFNDNEPDLNI